MAADFPAAVFAVMTRGALMSDATTQGAYVDKLQDEARAIEQTLGVNPQGAFATVRAWLDALPQGELAYAEATSSQASLEGGVDVTGLTTTFTYPATRRIRLAAYVPLLGSVSGDIARVDIMEGGTIIASHQGRLEGSNVGFHVEAVITPTAAAHTYKVSAVRSAGAGTLSSSASATNRAFILVQDIGVV